MSAILFTVIGAGVMFLCLQVGTLIGAHHDIARRCKVWFLSCQSGRRRHQSRSFAISELERSIAFSPWSTTLRKLGVVAPLLGVVLTAGSIVIGDSADVIGKISGTPSERSHMLSALAPLLAGVCTGAVLAILNQFFTSILHQTEARLVLSAIDTVDESSFTDADIRIEKVTLQIEAAGVSLAEAILALNLGVRESAEVVRCLNEGCVNSTKALSEVAGQLQSAVSGPARAFEVAAQEMTESARASGSQYARAASSLEHLFENATHRIGSLLQNQLESELAQVRRSTELESASKNISAMLDRMSAMKLPPRHDELLQSSRAAGDLTHNLSKASEGVLETGATLNQLTQQVIASVQEIGMTAEQTKQFRTSLSQLSESVLAASDSIKSMNLAKATEAPRGWRQSIFSSFRNNNT